MSIFVRSKDVAEMLGKRHDNLLRAIRKYSEALGAEATQYFVAEGEGRKATYKVTELGCDLLGARMLGEAGREYKEWVRGIFGNQPESVPQEPQVQAQPEPEVKGYSIKEVADALGVSERSVQRYIQAGKLIVTEQEILVPQVRRIITEEALEAFKAEREVS